MCGTFMLSERIQVLVRSLTKLTLNAFLAGVQTFHMSSNAIFVDGFVTIKTLNKVGCLMA